jgi:hypothetical protein
MYLNLAWFNCESTSSAIVITSNRTLLKSTRDRFFCIVLKVNRLRLPSTKTALISIAARAHRDLRRKQGSVQWMRRSAE